MNTKLFILLGLILFLKTFGQEQYIRDFEKLTVIDTIRSQEKINLLKNKGLRKQPFILADA